MEEAGRIGNKEGTCGGIIVMIGPVCEDWKEKGERRWFNTIEE